MSFALPGFLLLLALVPLAWFVPRRARDLGEGLTRSLALALLALALAHPFQRTEAGRPHVALVLDQTASAPAIADPSLDLPAHATLSRVVLEGQTTPLPAALAQAARAIPNGAPGAVVLVSDGLSTDRGWARATQDLVARGVPVHVRALPVPADDLRPVAIEPLGELRVGQVARVAVTVLGQADDLTVRLVGPEGELASLEGIVAGRTRALLEFEPSEAGYLRVTAEVSGADARPGNERLETTLAVQDPLRVLYLGEHAAGGAGRLSELLGAGFDVREEAPSDTAFANADLALLDDRSEASLDEAAQSALAEAVTAGGLGLVMAGGSAFGPGGWHDTPVMDLMPVEAVQKEEKRDPSTTLVVIIDTSGSMGGNRVQLAKEVARLSIQRLLPHDKVGIVEFYGAKRWAAPVQPASNRIELERALNRLNAGGGTVILPAIEEAFYGLQNVQTRYKHVLVLTDGGVERGAFEPLIRRMADEGITVSTVLIGPDAHSEFLVSISNWGKGRFYSVPNRFNLPEILLKQPTSAKLPAWRSGEHVVRARGGQGWWGDVDPTSVPALAGYVETRARPGAEVLLETEQGAHPILATWRPGLGRATALTTGPTGRGSEPWSEWEGYGAALGRILARTASDVRAPYAWSIERRGPLVLVTAERTSVGVAAPRLTDETSGEDVSLREVAPGLHEARLVVSPGLETWLLGRAGGTSTRLVSPPFADVAPETQVDPERGLDLARLAAATGGTELDAGALNGLVVELGGGDSPLGVRDLQPWCLLVALASFLANVAWRRRPAFGV